MTSHDTHKEREKANQAKAAKVDRLIRDLPEESARERREAEASARRLLKPHGFWGRIFNATTSTG